MKDYKIEVWFERDQIFKKEVDNEDEILNLLNCFDFSNKFLYFTVRDKMDKVVPHYYYDENIDSIVY